MGRIKKQKPPANSFPIVKTEIRDKPLRFSFSLFDNGDEEVCPEHFPAEYVQTLMQRLKDLSTWTLHKFMTDYSKTVRNHTIAWSDTARPQGFKHLNTQLRAYVPWQFSLSVNEHGRVHGIIIDEVFYIIWLDVNHKLYP